MKSGFQPIFRGLILGAALLSGCASPGRPSGSTDVLGECKRWRFVLERADQAMARGRWGRAAAYYRKYFRRCAYGETSVRARLGYAQALENLGKLPEAFDAYVELLETFPSSAPRDEALQHMLDIARTLSEQRYMRWIFGGFIAPERVVPLLEKIVELGPGWAGAPVAMRMLADLHRKLHEYEEASQVYRRLLEKYPDSEEAEEAAFGLAECLFRLSQRYPTDQQLREAAWAAVSYFLDRYRGSPYADSIHSFRKALMRQRARSDFEVARFYDRIARKPRAALAAYRQFVARYPHSEWTGAAQRRIQELEQQLAEKNNEQNDKNDL